MISGYKWKKGLTAYHSKKSYPRADHQILVDDHVKLGDTLGGLLYKGGYSTLNSRSQTPKFQGNVKPIPWQRILRTAAKEPGRYEGCKYSIKMNLGGKFR